MIEEDEKMRLIQEGMRMGQEHAKMSPDTRDRIIPIETQMAYINNDLKAIKDAINSTRNWIIITLIALIGTIGTSFFWIGSWKGGIDERVTSLEKHHIDLESKMDRYIEKNQK